VVSDDGRWGATVIAFVGTVFSPWYFAARAAAAKRGDPPPPAERFCGFNVAIYGPNRHWWALTERATATVHREARRLTVGPDTFGWEGDQVVISFDMQTMPFGGPVRGKIRLKPRMLPARRVEIAPGHTWQPVAPAGEAEVELDEPKVRFVGHAYHDANDGTEPLEAAFSRWCWARATDAAGTTVIYDVEDRAASPRGFAAHFSNTGDMAFVDAPRRVPLPHGFWWRVPRSTRAAADADVRLVRTLEDTPFYTRSQLEIRTPGNVAAAVHESLDLERFASPWVQFLLPFRIRNEALKRL
jgi:carotenoid 1,2-hydratase